MLHFIATGTLSSGKIKGYGLVSVVSLHGTGDGGRGSDSVQQSNQYVITLPLPFNSTSPLRSI